MPDDAKTKFYDWANAMLTHSPFDAKTNHLLAMVASLVQGNQGAVSYFYLRAKAAGASPAELEAATDIAVATTGLNLYSVPPKVE